MYEYMSWHVLLACTVGMCCTDCIVPFLHYRGGNLYDMGTVGNGNPNILRECWTFLIRIFLHQLRKQLCRILHFQTQEKFADIWLVLTIQTVIPVGLCYLIFVCENKQGNHCNWHKSFKELRLRRVQHYLSSLKEEKTLAVLIPLTLLPKTTTSLWT